MFEIHPSAAENFNKKILALIDKLEIKNRATQHTDRFENEVHIGATLTDKDIIREIKEAETDYLGNTVGRFFFHQKNRYGLVDDDHKTLIKIAEGIQELPSFENRISKKFVEDLIFEWIKLSYLKEKEMLPFIDYLIEEAKKEVQPVKIYVPVANTIVEQPFIFCDVTICNITKNIIDNITKIPKENSLNEEQKASIEAKVSELRRKFQGYAAVEMDLECEANYANELAITTARRVTSLLSIYSIALLMPDLKCHTQIKGTENLETATTFSFYNTNKFSMTESILEKSISNNWHISKADLTEYEQNGLGFLSWLDTKKNKTAFDKEVLNACILYSKAAFTSDPLEKLVYILSALESILLKNEGESIQQNLSERLAIFIAKELDDRKNVIRIIKNVYKIRSKYLHHGYKISDLEDLTTFLHYAWSFYLNLLEASSKYSNKADFIEAIEDQKLM